MKTAEFINETESGMLLSAIQRREHEKEALLSISHQMARIRDKNQLLTVINTHLRKLFYFTHTSISAITDDREHFIVFLTDPNSRSRAHADYNDLVSARYTIQDGVFETFLQSDKPTVSDYEEVLKMADPPRYAIIHYEAGIREAVSIPLQGDRDIWGVLHFYSDRKNTFTPDYVNIIKGVGDQVAIAVSNILANKDIKKREEEKAALLSISYAIGKVRDKEGLLNIINTRLKHFFYFTHSFILRICDDKENFELYLTDPESRTRFHPEYFSLISQKHPIKDGILDTVLESEEPTIINYEAIAKTGQVPRYINIHYEAGHREAVVVPLFGEKEVWGLLCFMSDKVKSFTSNYLNIIKGVASQVAVAVSNIVATEVIRIREQEKATLLSVSYDIGKVRDKNELLNFINTKLKTLFYFTHSSIAAINPDRETFTVFLTDEASRSRSHPEFNIMINAKYPINDGIFNKFLETDEPTISDIEKNATYNWAPRYTVIHYEAGLKEAVSIPLHGEKALFGILTFYSDRKNNFTPNNLNIIKGVAGQVAIAVSNILAHEEVRKREDEKTLLLSFSHDIASVRDKKNLATTISHYFRNRFMVNDFVLAIRNEDYETQSVFLADFKACHGIRTAPEQLHEIRIPVSSGITAEVLNSETPLIFDVTEQTRRAFPLPRSLWEAMGIKKIIGIRLRVGNENIGILWTQPGLVNDHLLKGICAQIAIAIANINANELIEKQLDEINSYKQRLEEEKLYLQEEVEGNYSEITGAGPEMQKIFHLLSKVSSSNTTVLILGETGTGKELIARAIHNNSARKDKLMVKVNCAALPANLIESELFGHEKGSFTGATERRIGKFELANNSTLFLDEIGEMPPDLQAKLLRALQEREIERLGGKTPIKIDVRIIAATNRNLKREVDAGSFRSDLYYRLNVFPIVLPALRERLEDIPALVSHFIMRYSKNTGKGNMTISNKTLQELMAYEWPGNVRELEHIIERSVLLTNGTVIKEVHLPVRETNKKEIEAADFKIKTIIENERDYILEVLKRSNGKMSGPGGAAELLGIPYSTLTSKMKKLGIRKERYFIETK